MTQNASWPRITDVVDFIDNRGVPIAGCLCWVEVTSRSRDTTGTDRGKQYSTDQQKAGTLRGVIDNYDSAFDPSNPNSAFYPNVLARRVFRRLAQYPVTANILTPDQATAGSWSGAPDGTMIQATGDTTNPGPGSSLSDQSGFLYVATTMGTGVRLTTVSDGPNMSCPSVYQVTAPSGSSSQSISMWVPVLPGQQYTVQMKVRATSGTVSMFPRIAWLGTGGAMSSTGVPATGSTLALTTGWQLVTVTGTAPATGIFGMRLDLVTSATALSGAAVIQSTAWQVEEAGSAGTWGLPGAMYSFVTAYNEGLPQSYDDTGQWGTVAVTASDLLALLNQGDLLDSIGSTIMQFGPSFYYRLDDAQGSTLVADAAGFRQLAPIVNPPNSGSVALGSTLTAATPSLVPVGSDASVATFTGSATAASGIDLTCGGIYPAGPAGGAATVWSRAIAFRCPAIPAAQATIWWSMTYGQFAAGFQVYINPTTGFLSVLATVTAGHNITYTGAASICDGNWHTVLVAASAPGTTTIYVDDVSVQTLTLGGGSAPGTYEIDFVGGTQSSPVTRAISYLDGFTGDIAHIAEWPTCITPPSGGWGLHQALVPAYAGDSASARWVREFLFAAPYGTYRASASVTPSVAPITDTDGDTAADAMSNMEVTEQGNGFISGWGIATFRSRRDRYNSTPIVVFGENTANGEVVYEQPGGMFDYDDLRLSSQIQVTQQPSEVVYTATDPRFPLPYGPAQMQIDNYATSAPEIWASAQYLLQRNQNPTFRLNQLRIHVGANKAWAQCLPLDLGSRIRVMRRPINGNPISWDGFVEKISWSFSPADAWLTIQASPADVLTYWMLAGPGAPGTAALTASVAAGANSISTSTLIKNLGTGGIYPGQTLVLDPGLTISEQVTVTGTPVVLVALSGIVINFVATVPISPTVNAHSSGATVAVAGAVAGAAGQLAGYSILGSTTRLAY